MSKSIILASSSPYRRELLARLQLDFLCISPEIDETPCPDEAPAALALRLAQEKAAAIARHHPAAIVIGSDQVAEVNGQLLGKPGTAARAAEQLQRCSGQRVTFHTGLCLQHDSQQRSTVEPYTVVFRELDAETIQRYIRAEPALDCAGSFKCEGLGVSLFARQMGDDPSSLMGLPLIKTCALLRELGMRIP